MIPFYNRASLGIVVALLASTSSVAQAAELPCFDEAAMQSARIHDLRVMLMVNALKCRFRHPEALRSYGELLEQRGQELTDHSRLVQLNLSHKYGDVVGPVAYNRYETAIANHHSVPDPSQKQCEDVAAYIDLAMRADHAELETLSKLVTNRAIDVCLTPLQGSAEVVAVGPETASETIAAARPIRVSIAEEAPQLVDGIPTYTVPGTGPDTAPEPLEVVALPAAAPASASAAAVSAPASPAVGANDKLDQAIIALSAAVAALSDLRQQP